MKINNCILCNSEITEENITDSGYNTFNVGSVTCDKCNFKLTFNNLNTNKEYISAWNISTNIYLNIINLSKKDKDAFIKYLIINESNIIKESYTKFRVTIDLKDDIENTKKILEENGLNLLISPIGELLVPKITMNAGFGDFLKNKLGIKLKIKSI